MAEAKPYVTEVITDPEILKTRKSESDSEIPVRIEVHGNLEHKTETLVFAREIHEYYCAEPDCEFFGKHASQGNCWLDPDDENIRIDNLIDQVEEEATKTWKEYLAESPEDAEAAYVCAQLNWDVILHECIRLRAENARLKNKLGEYK